VPHHAKEEHGLFAALEATGMPRENSAIGMMLREHEEARKIVGQIRTAVESYINNVSPETREDLVRYCEAFMSLISTCIYPQGGQQLCFHNRRKTPQSSGELSKKHG
jgi:hemerythrin-like domain-containing protein